MFCLVHLQETYVVSDASRGGVPEEVFATLAEDGVGSITAAEAAERWTAAAEVDAAGIRVSTVACESGGSESGRVVQPVVLRRFAAEIFTAAGTSDKDAETMARLLVEQDMAQGEKP